MNAKAARILIDQLRLGYGTDGPGTDAYTVMQRAALALEHRMDCRCGDDDAAAVSIELRIGDLDQTLVMMKSLRELQAEIADECPDIAASLDEILTRWNMTK